MSAVYVAFMSKWLLFMVSKRRLCLASKWLPCLASKWLPCCVCQRLWLLNASQCLCSLSSTWSLRRAFNCVIAAYASRPRSGLVVSTCGFRWLLCLFLDMMWLKILMSEDPYLNPITQHQETQLTLTTFHPQTLATSPTPKPSTPNPPPPPPQPKP